MKLKSLEKKFQLNPKEKCFFPLANAYREHNRLNECIKIFRQGLSVFPDYWAAKVALGRALFEKGDFDDALKELESASAHVPENSLLHELLASIYLKKGDLLKADYHCKLVLFVNPSHAGALRIKENTLKIRGKASQKESLHEKKKEFLEEGSISKEQVEEEKKEEKEIVTATLAELYVSQGLPERAIEIYQKLIKQQPEQEEEWKMRIAALHESQEPAVFPEVSPPEGLRKEDVNGLILQRLEAWLKNIEKYEKAK